MRKDIKGALLVSLAATMWGFDSIILTPNLYQLSVPFVVFTLHLIPAVGMSLFFGKEEIRNLVELPREDIFYYFLVALFGGAIGTLAIVKALFLVNFKYLTVVTLLQKLQPVFAILLAKFLLKEKLGKNFLMWAFIAIIFGYLLTFQFTLPTFKTGENILLASIYSMISAFSFGSATVFGKRVLKHSNFRTALYIRFLFTTIIMFFIVLVTKNFGEFFVVNKKQWMIFITIALTTGSGAILIYYIGLKDVKAKVATMCELCFPISSIVFDYIFNGRMLSPVQIVSAACMLFSIYNITKNNK